MPRKAQERTSRPGEYYGAKAICERLGISRRTLYDWIETRQLLVYRRRGPHSRQLLFTSEALIERWQLAQAIEYQQERARLRNRIREAHKLYGSSAPAPSVPRTQAPSRFR